MKWSVEFTLTASSTVREIKDVRVQGKILDRPAELSQDPEKQGKPLLEDLKGCRSVRAVGQRYRMIYRLNPTGFRVIVVAVGLRKEGDQRDIYSLARRLVRQGLLGGH